MSYPEEQGFSEEFISIKPRVWYAQWYWLLTLWIAAIGVFTGIGYYTSGVEAPPRLLAAMSEVWSNMFALNQEQFVEVIDTNQAFPRVSLLEEPDRVITRGAVSSGVPEVAGAATDGGFCDISVESVPARNRILINEIAWMGGPESSGLDARDEWIELKNISPSPIDIGGWRLNDDDGQISAVFAENTFLTPGGFYILERTDDGSIPHISAGLLYKGALANEDDGLRLFNADCQLEDEALANPNWPAGNAAQRRTLERSASLSWHTFSGPAEGIVFGTPGAENSEPITTIKQEELPDEQVNCSLVDLNKPTHEVLINEVAWSGVSGNTSGEWIELYYPGRSEMNLAGWQLLDIDSLTAVDFEEKDLINGYFLMRRILTTEDPVMDYEVAGKRVDKTYTGVIQNSDEALYLFDADCVLVDRVDNVGINWKNIGGTASPDYRTAERTNEGEWHTYGGSGKEDVMGTPKAQNSKAVSSDKTPANTSGGSGGSSLHSDEPAVDWCSQETIATSTYAVLINEVAWAGGVSSTSAEWIELYNPSAAETLLAGWQLLDKDGEIKIVFDENDKISSHFLLTRILASDDPGAIYTVGGVTADKTYTGVLQNAGETLRLFDASCNLVDEVVDVGDDWGNIGGTASPDYRTAERVDEGIWQTYIGDGVGGIMGTPRAENSRAESPPEEEEPPDGGEEEPPPEEEPDLTGLEITEIVFDVEGADDGLERVIISNSTSTDVLIGAFSLQYLRAGDDFTAIKKKNFESGDTVPANGVFVIGISCSAATPCEGVDMSWSQSLANDGGIVYLVFNQEDITDASDPDIVHFLVYDAAFDL
ncbi:MAG: lamin tail domain-containing protein [Candidatus Colwellbacteria bacterium]|nr:lamin tail domain-containing protein [Candidatus Colwellbacteria bacterium]